MFKNSGGSIKALAVFIFIIVLLCGIAFGAYLLYLHQYSTRGIVFAAFVVVVSFAGAWLATLFLYSYGQLVQSNERAEKNLIALNKKLDLIIINGGFCSIEDQKEQEEDSDTPSGEEFEEYEEEEEE